jgi:PAS domain S-box-containing protein
MDITERAQQYRATFENAAVGIAHLDPDIRCRQANQALARIVGYPDAELVGMAFVDLTCPDDVARSLGQIQRVRDGTIDSYELEKRHMHKDGSSVWVRVSVSCVRRDDGTIDHFVDVVQDISVRRQAQEQVQFLMREMNHRAKNMLSLVQAVAQQTAARDSGHFLERFVGRLQALAANQELLVRNEWRGVDVEDLIRAQLAHFADCLETRIALHGPRLHLNAAAAQAIGLALHELATNAGKYGALSTRDGHVDIGWQVDGMFSR